MRAWVFLFAAAQAAQKFEKYGLNSNPTFAAAQAAQKLVTDENNNVFIFAAAQAAQKKCCQLIRLYQ